MMRSVLFVGAWVNHDHKADYCRFIRNGRGVSFLSCATATHAGWQLRHQYRHDLAENAGRRPVRPGRDELPRLLASAR
jgi:hypothetical protein